MSDTKIIGFLSAVFNDMSKEEIEDAMQDAAVSVIEKGDEIKHKKTYQVRGTEFRLRDLRKRKLHEATPAYLEETDESEMSYDPTEAMNLSIDVSRVLTRNFTPKECQIIISYFGEGTSTHQLAREYPSKNQRAWHRWLEGKVRPLLRKELADYADIFNGVELQEAV